jgi:hypothetical protein
MAHAIGSCSRADPKTQKGFQLCEKQCDLTELCKNFWGQPKKLSDIEKGADIKFNFDQLEETDQRLYFLEQYGYLRDRIDALRACDSRKKWRERERDIYILPWLQVRITGPRHHLTSSLRNYAQGYDKTGCYLQYVSKYGL